MTPTKEYQRAYRDKNKERLNAYHRKWEKNPKRVEWRRKWRITNAEKMKQYHRGWRKKEAERYRAIRRRCEYKQYGLTLEQADALLNANGGMCEICYCQKATHIDHCHASNTARGALCNGCNTGLGMFKDNPAFLLNAVKYLSRAYEHQKLNGVKNGA